MCHAFLLPKVVSAQTLTADLVKETHGILTAGSYDERRFFELGERPGAFKKHYFVAGGDNTGSAPGNVGKDIQKLLEDVAGIPKDTEPMKLLTAAAYFHARFEHIRPFADGNGRAGRSLMNYLLMIHGHPPLIVFEEDRWEYFNALQFFDELEDISPLREFLCNKI